MNDHTVTVVTVIGGTLSILAALWKAWRVLDRKVITPFSLVLEDWNGTPGRPEVGVLPRPGLMVRMYNVEVGLRQVHSQVNPNGGGSMYDKVTQIKTAVETNAPEAKP